MRGGDDLRGNDTKAVSLSVMPAEAGIQKNGRCWIPAFAGMTALHAHNTMAASLSVMPAEAGIQD